MAIIALSGVPPKLTLPRFTRQLSWIIKGHFQALGFEQKKKNEKVCYIRLSPKLNVQGVMGKINTTPFGKVQLKAFIPKKIPNLGGKKVPIPDRLRRMMKIAVEMDPDSCFVNVHTSIIREMEHKYTGLNELSKKTNHMLMENICLTVRDRLRVVAHNSSILDNPHKFTLAYRKAHPHFGDFQLILSTLHMIEDAEGQPRSQIVEKELILKECEKKDNDFDKIQESCHKYSDRILKKVKEHVRSLKTEPSPDPTEEEKARIAVRTQIQKLTPYLSLMVNQVMCKYFKPMKGPLFQRIRIYGEPYLPCRELLEPFTKQHRARTVYRSDQMFNLLHLKVAAAQLEKLLSCDGTVIGANKLVIRVADTNTFKMPDSLKSKITLSPKPNEETVPMEEIWEQW